MEEGTWYRPGAHADRKSIPQVGHLIEMEQLNFNEG